MIRRVSLFPAAGVVTLGLALVSSGLALRAGPSGNIISKDIQSAKRDVRPIVGTDERAEPIPAAVAAGNAIIEPADRETKVAASVPGRIESIAVHEGDMVTEGAVLMQLEGGPERAALVAAQADVKAAQADYEKAFRGQRREDIDAAIGDAEAAQARAASSADVYRRLQQLVPGVSTTQDELEKGRRQAESDQRTADASEARRKAAVAGSRYEDIAAARAKLASAAAKETQAQATLDRLTVRAPLAGEVLQLKYRAGEYETPGGGQDPLVVIGDTRKLRARIDIDERDIGRVQVGARAYVTADAYPGRKFAGTTVEIGKRMGRKNVRTDDPTERIDTKIVEVVVALDAPQGLIPGLRVTGYVERPSGQAAP